MERRRLEEELREQRGLIDALTAEMMTLREEAAALQVRPSLPYGLSLHYCPDSDWLFLSLWLLSGPVAAADSRAGAEVGHSGVGDGGTWTTGGTH